MITWTQNQKELISSTLTGKTILKIDFPFSMEFTDGTAIQFDHNDDTWNDVLTYYEAGDIR